MLMMILIKTIAGKDFQENYLPMSIVFAEDFDSLDIDMELGLTRVSFSTGRLEVGNLD